MRAARLTVRATVRRSCEPRSDVKYSGCSRKLTSCTVTTVGIFENSGAVYCTWMRSGRPRGSALRGPSPAWSRDWTRPAGRGNAPERGLPLPIRRGRRRIRNAGRSPRKRAGDCVCKLHCRSGAARSREHQLRSASDSLVYPLTPSRRIGCRSLSRVFQAFSHV